MVSENREKFGKGCVHSFTGTKEELMSLLALDLYIGVNGVSLKTEESIEVVKSIPLNRLMIESNDIV